MVRLRWQQPESRCNWAVMSLPPTKRRLGSGGNRNRDHTDEHAKDDQQAQRVKDLLIARVLLAAHATISP